MLKSEHLLCTIRSGSVKPKQIAVNDAELLELAAELLELYTTGTESGLQRYELADMVSTVIKSSTQPKIASGLDKLLLDRCNFAPAAEVDYCALRRERFLASGKLLRQGVLEENRDDMDIYGDLPEFEKLQEFKPLSPEQLLAKYNLAQAQSLLLHAGMLRLKLTDPEVSELRRVMKAVKFFRLLAQFSTPAPGTVTMEISGSYTLFGPTAKYAISLASLLPVLCRVKKWTLEADVKLKNRDLKLKLSDKNGFVSPNNAFSTYIPEEIRLYHKLFAQKSETWVIAGETPFIDTGDQQIIFPDLSFCNKLTGELMHLELFHRWHQGQLAQRLEKLNSMPALPLFIGIDRALVKGENGENEIRSRYPEIAGKIWFFRDFPGVDNTLRMLKKLTS